MRIGIDFDDTIADLTAAKVAYARERHAVTLHPTGTYRTQAVPLLGEEHYEEMLTALLTQQTIATPPVDHAIEALAQLGASHELFVVTARYEQEAVWSRRWLEHHGIAALPVVPTGRELKAEAARALALDMHLDDSVQEVRELHTSATRSVLFVRPHNERAQLPSGLPRVAGWRDFLDLCARSEGASA